MYTHTQNFFKYYTEILQTTVNKTASLDHAGQWNSQNLKLCYTILNIKVGKVMVQKLTVGELAPRLTKFLS